MIKHTTDGEGCQLFPGDAYQLLDTMPAGCVDLVLTDPPYGTTAANWDDKIDYERLFGKLWRVLKPNGALLMFSQNPVAAKLICMNPKTFRYQWVWEKTNAVGILNANRMPLRAHELILVFYRKLPTYNKIPLENQKGKPYKEKSRESGLSSIYGKGASSPACASTDGSRCPRDVIRFGRDKKHWGHSAQKPAALLQYLIRQYSNPGELILDPFAGSGSTLAAAQAAGRRAIGCELDPVFCATICRRCGLPQASPPSTAYCTAEPHTHIAPPLPAEL